MIQLTEAQPLTAAGPLCVGGAMTAEVVIETGLAAPQDLELFAAFATWTQPGAVAGLSAANPAPPYFSFQMTPGTPLLTTFLLAWGGAGANDANNRPARARLYFDNTSGALRLHFTFLYLNALDMEGYPDGARLPNAGRLLKDRKNAVAPLGVSAQSVYGQAKTLGMTCWLREPNGDVSSIRLESAPQALRFYDAEHGGAPAALLHSPTFELERGGQPVGELSAFEPTLLRVGAQTAGPVAQRCRLIFLRTDTQNDAADYMDNYEMDYVEIVSGMTRPYGGWGASNTVFQATPLSLLAPSGPLGFATEVEIDPAKLDPQGRYRVAALWEGFGPEDYAFLSPEFRADACPSLCPPVIESRIADYRREYGDSITAAPRERLESRLSVVTAGYDACRAAPFADAVRGVGIRIYAEENGRRYVLAEEAGARGPAGWSLPAGFAVTPDPAAGRWNLSYRFRLRADANRAERYSEDLATGQTAFTSDTTQDWTGRDLFIEIRLRLAQTQPVSFEDELVVLQRVDVDDYDPAALTGVFTDTQGAPVSRICPEDDDLRLCVENAGAGAALVGVLETDAGPDEHESFPGELPQLASARVAQMDAAFSGGRACVVFRAERLAPGRRYRFVAIEKED